MLEFENLKKHNDPFLAEYQNAFDAVLKSGWYILGHQVQEFETQFASYCNSRHCIGVANGLDALTIALKAFDFTPRKEVIVPANTYIATILSILNCNLKPVLVEPDIHTYNIDPTRLEDAITANTVAIMAVHLYGKCCAMEQIQSIATKYNLRLIEDCAQAHGAAFRGKKAGTFGDFGAFSFYPTKNLGALGDGGCLTCNADELNNIVRKLRNYGSEKKYFNDLVGMNSRLDELQAAFLSIKLKKLDVINGHKRRLASLYHQNLKKDFILPDIHADYYDVFHIFAIRHPKRDALKGYLLENGVGTEIHYPVPPHKQKALQELFEGQHFPISEEIHSTVLSLPISFFHTEADIEQVIEILNRF